MPVNPRLGTLLEQHQVDLCQCRRCPDMTGPVVTGQAVAARIMLIGQAPGDREGLLGRPFAWTAGKTLFQWFEGIGLAETQFRQRVYMAAVCRCFPGKKPKGGDRVPSTQEIENCSNWLNAEIELLKPDLLIPVGKLAISRFLAVNKLTEVIGSARQLELRGQNLDVICLPHPSGASTWHRTEPGRTLLLEALAAIRNHPAWKDLLY